jgi:hypothetical protein
MDIYVNKKGTRLWYFQAFQSRKLLNNASNYLQRTLKGTVQRDVTGVEIRLIKSVLMNYISERIFLYLKDHRHEWSIILL